MKKFLRIWAWAVFFFLFIVQAHGVINLSSQRPMHDSGMTFMQALVLGVVEGLTEYLPVSSTGHLLLAQRVMGISGEKDFRAGNPLRKEASDAYAVCIQGGAILAVLLLYWGRISSMATGLLGKHTQGLNLALKLGLAFLPAAVVGLLFEGVIKRYLFGAWPIVVAWFAGGVLILWFSRRNVAGAELGRGLEDLGWKGAVLIGLIQCTAMWPGVSRSLATILGGLVVGLSLGAAVEFSFLLGMLTLGAATIYDMLSHGRLMLQFFQPVSMAGGFLAAFFSAVVAVRWMVGYLQKHGLQIFGYYRMVLAVAVSILLLLGVF
ncbi:MAG: undecaprenyl-diphosphate phosphatase [bacterium]